MARGLRQTCAGLEIRFWPEPGNTADIEYLAFMRPDFGVLPDMPNLKAMFSRSAGVDGFIDHPRLPKAPIGKVEPSGGDPMMTEYVVMHVLRFHREMPLYAERQKRHEWGACRSSGRRSGASASSATA